MRHFNGEQEAIKQVVKAGAAYGYGNMIDRLKIAWLLKLKESLNCSWKTACLGAGLDSERTDRIIKAANNYEAALIIELKEYVCKEV